MGRYCSECDEYKSCSNFSRNQWMKGDGYSRCKDCVNGYGGGSGGSYVGYRATTFQCGDCYRTFNSQNELDMHMQVHRPREVACPVCGERRFRSGANAVQHVESGYCIGCRGQENARRQIYDYARSKSAMSPYMTGNPMLEYGGGNSSVPDYPYSCEQCNKVFRQLSQLLQHQDQKHNNHRLLGY